MSYTREQVRNEGTWMVASTPDPLAPGRMRERVRSIELMRTAAGPGASIVGWVEGPLALGAEMRGLSALMMDVYEDPGFVGDLLAFTSAVGMAYWLPQVEAGADTIGMSDAAASMMSVQHYEAFVFPAQRRVVEDIKARRPDVIVRIHMCGATDHLLPVMRRLPADVFELDFPVDPGARSTLDRPGHPRQHTHGEGDAERHARRGLHGRRRSATGPAVRGPQRPWPRRRPGPRARTVSDGLRPRCLIDPSQAGSPAIVRRLPAYGRPAGRLSRIALPACAVASSVPSPRLADDAVPGIIAARPARRPGRRDRSAPFRAGGHVSPAKADAPRDGRSLGSRSRR
jgi:hypothetical protein